MKPETIDTLTRHLKGIVAALEKEKVEQTLYATGINFKPETFLGLKDQPMIFACDGKELKDCTDGELKDALWVSTDKGTGMMRSHVYHYIQALIGETRKRGIYINDF